MKRLFSIGLMFSMMLVMIGGANAQETPALTISEALQDQIERIEIATETLRQLEAQTPIAIGFPTRADVALYLEGAIAEQYTPEALASDVAFYRAFNLIPADYDLLDEIIALYQGQVAGYYDTETQVMNVILMSGQAPGDALPLLDRVIYAHEYVHALQDQYFDLDAYYETVDANENIDALLARVAVIEGDATTIMNEYTVLAVEENPVIALIQVGVGALQAGNLTIPAGTPRVIEQELLWPYLGGEQFIRAVHEDGGWDAVNALYSENAPQSTEQILHPERFLAGDAPQTVTLEADPTLLGDTWETARTNTMGEFYLREWLIALDWERETVDLAATGWGGDRYAIYRDAEGALALQLVIAWDSAADAAEFADAFSTWQALTAPDTSTDSCVVLEDSATCIATDDAQTVITIAPQRATAETLLAPLAN